MTDPIMFNLPTNWLLDELERRQRDEPLAFTQEQAARLAALAEVLKVHSK